MPILSLRIGFWTSDKFHTRLTTILLTAPTQARWNSLGVTQRQVTRTRSIIKTNGDTKRTGKSQQVISIRLDESKSVVHRTDEYCMI